MHATRSDEVPPWSYLLARFPAKKESEFFLLKKKKHIILSLNNMIT